MKNQSAAHKMIADFLFRFTYFYTSLFRQAAAQVNNRKKKNKKKKNRQSMSGLTVLNHSAP